MINKVFQLLNQDWEFQKAGDDKWHDATVPGCVHQDLFANDLIPDPFFGVNESKLQWIMDSDWSYRLFFTPSKEIINKKNKILSFSGIDTYADIYLNGEKIIFSNNMFHPWEKDVSNLLKSGKNELKVVFHSPTKKVLPIMKQKKYKLPADNDQAGDTSPYTRKAPYHYGWDWGPCFVTSGVWKDVILHGWDSWYVMHSSLLTNTIERDSATLSLELEIFSDVNEEATILIDELKSNTHFQIPVALVAGKNIFKESFSINNPDLWWPAGHGEQLLYTFKLSIESISNSIAFSKRIGIRDVFIKREKDEKGASFEIYVNGKPIFSKGANWIPADSFTTRISKEKYKNLIATARESNMNTLRIWGGGIYEPDIFYELCDEMGIMVWQDFMFACSMYPAHEQFLESVGREATYQVKRLKSHPSIILWCGNNEIASGWLSWGWKEELPSSVWDDYKSIFHNLLPEVCEKHDPGRLYWPSSPGHSIELPKDDQIYGSGDNHYWGVWHGGDGFDAFEDNIGRFLSEYGMQSFPEMATIMKFAEEKDLDTESEVMKSRQKASLGTGNLLKYIEEYFGPQSNFRSIVVLSQITQALAIKTAVEIHRRSMPFCMGTLYWQFNDCWPAISWSSVDYYGNWKALHYHAKRFFNPIIITFREKEDYIHMYVINDQHKTVESVFSFQLLTLDGNVLKQKSFGHRIEMSSSHCVFSMDKKEFLQDKTLSELFLHAEISADNEIVCNNHYFFVKPKDLNLPEAIYDHQVQKSRDVISIKIQASSFIYQLYVTCNNADGVFSDNYFDVLAGQRVTIYFHPNKEDLDFEYDFSINTILDVMNR